jgi:hypothetical protein
MCINLAV